MQLYSQIPVPQVMEANDMILSLQFKTEAECLQAYRTLKDKGMQLEAPQFETQSTQQPHEAGNLPSGLSRPFISITPSIPSLDKATEARVLALERKLGVVEEKIEDQVATSKSIFQQLQILVSRVPVLTAGVNPPVLPITATSTVTISPDDVDMNNRGLPRPIVLVDDDDSKENGPETKKAKNESNS